jgi:hypothetical protein
MENPSELIIVNSTKSQIEEFKSSILWQDFQRELSSWVEGFSREQNNLVNDIAKSNPSTASVLTHLGHIAGCKDAVNYILDLPDRFLEYLEEKKQTKQSEVSDGK